MSNSGSFSDFNSLIDKATNPMQLEPDSETLKKICYSIDKGIVESTYAVQALYGKMTDDNPHTVIFALKVLERIFYDCGNLAHRVICTDNFMCLLKDIVQTTQQRMIRDKILELVQTWAVKFKYLPQYSAPEKLLRSLQADGYVFPDFENDVASESKTRQFDNNAAMHGKSKLVSQVVLKLNDCNNKDSGIDSDTDMKIREDSFKRSLREYQEMKNRDFKQKQKSLGLPTSSDEEDNGNVSNQQESHFLYEEKLPETYSLTAGLKKIKESRQAVERELQEYRNSKKEEFKQKQPNVNGSANEILQLRSPESCSTCEKYKKKNCDHENTFERITPRLHPDLKKVKESREIIKKSFEEIKIQKSRDFYAAKSTDWIDKSSYNSYRNKDTHETESQQIQKALEISQTDTHSHSHNLRKPRTRLGELEEQRDFEEAIRLSLLETRRSVPLEDEDEELQRAIDISIAQVDEENFSAYPKLESSDDDNVTLSYMAELSLNDSYKEELKLAEHYADYDIIEPCVICTTETRILKYFKPCNHKCICDSCSKLYTSQQCPICRQFYTSITF